VQHVFTGQNPFLSSNQQHQGMIQKKKQHVAIIYLFGKNGLQHCRYPELSRDGVGIDTGVVIADVLV